MIQQAQSSMEEYDLVMSDLEMETKNTGMGVVKEALKTIAHATIVTVRNYEKPDDANHGPNTLVLPKIAEKDSSNWKDPSIKGRKNKPGT